LYETIQARCLFATHYHELTHLQNRYPGIVSYYAASKKSGDAIIFLYTMVRGVADGSFGVQVAKLAQLPAAIVMRAQELVEHFDSGQPLSIEPSKATQIDTDTAALARLTNENDQLRKQIKTLSQVNTELQVLDFDDISPKKALDILWKMKGLL